MPEVSVIIPVYNEKQSVHMTVRSVKNILEDIAADYEIIVIDDGSTDQTFAILQELALIFTSLKPIRLARNFGKEAALACGLDFATGDAIIFMDGDLQHPPSAIVEMHAKWRSGNEIVHGVKRSRGEENWFYKLCSYGFNALFTLAIGFDFTGQSDFKLIDKKVAETLRQLPEKERFLRGLVSWVGFSSATVEFDVQPRFSGTSKWGFFSLIAYSFRNLTAFSSTPLYWITVLGLVLLVSSVFLSLQTLWNYFSGNAVTGFTTVITLMLLLGGLGFLSLGIMAAYLAQLFREIKGRPIYIVSTSMQTERNPDSIQH